MGRVPKRDSGTAPFRSALERLLQPVAEQDTDGGEIVIVGSVNENVGRHKTHQFVHRLLACRLLQHTEVLVVLNAVADGFQSQGGDRRVDAEGRAAVNQDAVAPLARKGHTYCRATR